GDMATVARVGRRMELYGRRFVKAVLCIDGYEEEVTAWVMTDTLMSDYPALTYAESREFYRAVEADYMDIASKKKRFEKVRENEYYNALQIKFAYAVTCHKAQGGQWDAVFIDQGWLPDDQLNDEYWRWLYTAITRARERVYFINFKEDFFSGEGR
ncbi:MAG: ATP-binding domain-containing protein, partial [Odoribacter sp.]|nr:ATP-binding domain-containing protein [Odoribacter sp.]